MHSLLDADGKETGRIEGRYVLSRKADVTSRDLGDEALKGVALEPNAENTLLLYDNPDFGVRFVYPRRWHPAAVRGSQLALDGADGSGLLHDAGHAGADADGRAVSEGVAELAGEPQGEGAARRSGAKAVASGLEHFALDDGSGGTEGGDGLLRRRARPTAGRRWRRGCRWTDLDALQKEVEGIARSLTITKKIEDRK